MNIETVIDYINKEFGYDISGSYYPYIREWQDWWRGKYKPFHSYKQREGQIL